MKKNRKSGGFKIKSLTAVGMRVVAIVTGVLIIAVGILCTSPSKAADDAPYFPPEDPFDETEPEETDTDPVTSAETTAADTAYDTGEASSETGTAEETTDTGTTSDVTAPGETTAAATTEEETTAPPPVTVTEKETTQSQPSSGAEGMQEYREYNGRSFYPNETFVGEYKTDRVSIGVSHVVDGKLSYFICDIKVKSVKDFRTAFANNSIGGRAYTHKIAQSVGAGFAINGDFCGFRNSGIIIRNGGLYRDKKSDDWDLCYLNKYGDLISCRNDAESGKKLVNVGVWQSWCFGPTLVKDYKALKNSEFNTPDLSRKDWARESRTAIGQVDRLHYIFIVVDAKRVVNATGKYDTVEGTGMNFDELAAAFEALGCKTAYNLDGGASTSLWMNGKVINVPCMEAGARQVSDIVYFK